MKKIFRKKIMKRLICLILVAGLFLTDMPVQSLAAQAGDTTATEGKFETSSDVLTM